MQTTQNTMILETVPAGAEVYEMSSSTVEVAMKLGREVADIWTRRGYAMQCVGVTPHSANVEHRDYDSGDRLTAQTVRRDGFFPVLVLVAV